MGYGNGHQPNDARPQTCRNRLRDEGHAYPRSDCASCGNGGLVGCPHDRRPAPPTTGSGVKPPRPANPPNLQRIDDHINQLGRLTKQTQNAIARLDAIKDALATLGSVAASDEIASVQGEIADGAGAIRQYLGMIQGELAKDSPPSPSDREGGIR